MRDRIRLYQFVLGQSRTFWLTHAVRGFRQAKSLTLQHRRTQELVRNSPFSPLTVTLTVTPFWLSQPKNGKCQCTILAHARTFCVWWRGGPIIQAMTSGRHGKDQGQATSNSPSRQTTAHDDDPEEELPIDPGIS